MIDSLPGIPGVHCPSQITQLLAVQGLQNSLVPSVVIKAFFDGLGWVVNLSPSRQLKPAGCEQWCWFPAGWPIPNSTNLPGVYVAALSLYLEEKTILCTTIQEFHLGSCLGPLQVCADDYEISGFDQALIVILIQKSFIQEWWCADPGTKLSFRHVKLKVCRGDDFPSHLLVLGSFHLFSLGHTASGAQVLLGNL